MFILTFFLINFGPDVHLPYGESILFLSLTVAELTALKLYTAPHNPPSLSSSRRVGNRIRELLGGMEYGRNLSPGL
jgi:hypothetical protein